MCYKGQKMSHMLFVKLLTSFNILRVDVNFLTNNLKVSIFNGYINFSVVIILTIDFAWYIFNIILGIM